MALGRRCFLKYSRSDLTQFAVTPFAVVWAAQIYGTVGNHPDLAWLYIPFLALCTFRLTVFAIAYVVALIVNEVAGARLPVAEIGLGVQTVLIVYWAFRGKLLRRPLDGSSAARPYRWFLGAARPCFIVIAVLLACGLLFRNKPVIECVLWPICLMAVACSIPRQPVRWRSAPATTALTLVSIAGSLAVLEFGARLLLPPAPGPSDMYMPDPICIFTLRPNSKSDFTVQIDSDKTMVVEAVISPQGVRDRAIGPKEQGEFRIVTIGDSYTMGHGLPPEQTVSHALEGVLNQAPATKRYTVINCGVGGYAPWQERGFLNARGFSFDPDLVILQVFPANDVAGTLTRVGKYLQVSDVGWENRVNMFRSQNRFPVNVQRWLERNVLVYAVAAQALYQPNLAIDVLGDVRFLSIEQLPVPAQAAHRNPYREASLIEWYPELEEGYRLMEDDIRGIRDDCRARGVDLIAYCHPFPMGVIADGFEKIDRETEGTLFEKDKDVRVTQEIFARAGVPFVNVTEALESQADPSALYFMYDGHFTARGAEVVARKLADYFLHSYVPQQEQRP